jgi:CubicO group peptidase (beta-lactamase class C family)
MRQDRQTTSQAGSGLPGMPEAGATVVKAALIVLGTMQLAFVSAAAAQAPSDNNAAATPPAIARTLDSSDLQAWLDGLLPHALKTGDIAGVVVAVVKDGNVLLQRGYGYADVDKRIRMDPEKTEVRPGSTSKLFTWTAVMQLVEQGKLDLHRNVDDYLDFKVSPPSGKPITLVDLMNHRGGFEEGIKGVLATDPHELQSTEMYLKQHPRPLLFPTGEVPAYSNYGAALAGYIVQRVSGERFEQYLDRHIFQPLGMLHSTFEQPLPQRLQDGVAKGYRTASDPPGLFELIVTGPAGSMTTTAADMTRFMFAHLQEGRVGSYEMLRSQTAQLMYTPSQPALPGFATMAHGFFYETKNGHTVIGHGGDTVTFHTELYLLPQQAVGIFYSFNSRGRDDAVYGLRRVMFDGFVDRYFPESEPRTDPPTPASIGADALAIAGRYQSSRRIEHGFLSVFYLLQQTVITANPDGTIGAPKFLEEGYSKFREIAPQVWHEVGGTRQLALRDVGGVKTVLDSDDPTEVLQLVPPYRSAPVTLTVLLGSIAILAMTIVSWPISWLVNRRYGVHTVDSIEQRRARLALRLSASFDLVYLVAWILVLLPVLSLQLEVYSDKLDPVIRALQVSGLFVIAAAAVGVWSLWSLCTSGVSRMKCVRSGLVVLALLGVMWTAFLGQLIGFNVNY